MRACLVKSSRRMMRMRSVTSRCTRAISALPAAATSAQWKASSHCATCTVSAAALGRRHQPDRGQLRRAGRGRPFAVGAQALHGRGLQHHAQVVELLELLEVERQHAPAAAKQHLDVAFLLQAEQGLAHRRARDAQALAEFVLGEAVARHQLEVGHVALELLRRPRRRASGCGRLGRAGRGGRSVVHRGGLYQARRSAAARALPARPADDGALRARSSPRRPP